MYFTSNNNIMWIPAVAKTQDLRGGFKCVKINLYPLYGMALIILNLPDSCFPKRKLRDWIHSFPTILILLFWSECFFCLFIWNLKFKLLWLGSQFSQWGKHLFFPFSGTCVFSWLFPSIICQLATFGEHGFGNQMCQNDWPLEVAQSLFTFSTSFFHCQWRCQPWGRKAVCGLNSTAWEGFWRWKTRISCIAVLQCCWFGGR